MQSEILQNVPLNISTVNRDESQTHHFNSTLLFLGSRLYFTVLQMLWIWRVFILLYVEVDTFFFTFSFKVLFVCKKAFGTSEPHIYPTGQSSTLVSVNSTLSPLPNVDYWWSWAPADITNLPSGPLISFFEIVRYKNIVLEECTRILKNITSFMKPKPDVGASVFFFA